MTNSGGAAAGGSPRPSKRSDGGSASPARWVAKAGFALADLALPVPPGPRVLIYHDVKTDPRRQMEITPTTFARHIDWLVGHGRVVALEDAVSDPGHPDSHWDFVLTFDDGYRGVFDHAYPILLERDLPFTIYLTTNVVGLGDAAGTLGWSEVNEMADSGLVTIGAHTHSHPDMRDLTALESELELERSNDLIEMHTGVLPKHFAYPFGFWSESSERAVRKHYDTAVLGAGPPITKTTDLHRLSRLPVQLSDGFFMFTRKIQRGMRLEEAVRRRMKGYQNPSSTSVGSSDIDRT